jgi:hypothetical protein
MINCARVTEFKMENICLKLYVNGRINLIIYQPSSEAMRNINLKGERRWREE